MSLLSLPSDAKPVPVDRLAREAWLVEQADTMARHARAALRRIVGEAYSAWTNSLQASGDLAVLNTIPHDWVTWVEQEMTDALSFVYYSGSVTAWTTFGAELSHQQMAGWESVVNHAAVEYMDSATNRLAQVGERLWRDVRAQTVTALEKGLSVEQLKSNLEGITQWSEYRADTVARTETMSAYVRGEYEAQRAFGSDGPVEKVWLAALDDRTRESHAAADGQCVPIDQPFYVGGVAMDAPFDPGAPPEEVVNCRCVVNYLYPGDERPDGSVIEAAADTPDDTNPDPTT